MKSIYVNKIIKKIILLLITNLILFSTIYPQFKLDTNDESPQKNQEQIKTIFGFNFGYGIAATLNERNIKSIDEAKIVNGKIMVTKLRNNYVKILLETHYLWPIYRDKVGLGIFIATDLPNTSNNTFFNFLALGTIIAFKYPKKTNKSFNIGIGAFIDTSFKTLPWGLHDGDNVPEGMNSLELVEKNISGYCIIFTYAWKL